MNSEQEMVHIVVVTLELHCIVQHLYTLAIEDPKAIYTVI